MITLEQARDWLNFNSISHLSHQTKYNLWELNDPTLTEDEKDRLIEYLIARTHTHPPSLEYAEVLMECGNFQRERGCTNEALSYFKRACDIYRSRDDDVRSATALWMMSLLEWSILNHYDAYAHAYTSRGIMEKLTCSTAAALNPGMGKWCKDRLDEMNLDLIVTPEEGYEWLTQFEPSRIQASTRQVMASINEAVKNKRLEQANCLLANLQSMAQRGYDHMEEAEVLAFTALIRNQMGDVREACQFFRQSMMQYPPRKHHYAVLTWVLGLLQYRQTSEGSRAITAYNDAILMMEHLKISAKQGNRMIEHDWYQKHLDLMRKVLQARVAEMVHRTV